MNLCKTWNEQQTRENTPVRVLIQFCFRELGQIPRRIIKKEKHLRNSIFQRDYIPLTTD